MSTVLVTGATGFLGRRLVDVLRQAGYTVRGAVREQSPALPADVNQIAVGDMSDGVDWVPAVADTDYVVHVAGRAHRLRDDARDPLAEFRKVNTDATISLAEAAQEAGVERFVFVSTIGVNGSETHGTPFTAVDTPQPHSPYAVSKWEAEQALGKLAEASAMEIVILRPPLILGENPKGNLALIHQTLRRGLPLPFAMVDKNRRSFVTAERLAHILVACLVEDRAANTTFTLADPQPLSTRAFIAGEAARLGVKLRLVPVPPGLLSFGLGLLGKGDLANQLLGDLEVDGSAANAILDDYEQHQQGTP